MEYHINIDKIDKLVHPNTVESVGKEHHRLRTLFPESCIHRVHERLRKENPEAYTPMLVSIGPYHIGNPKLCAMKEHKMRYLHSLLERRKEDSVERYILELVKLEDRARKCYANAINLDGNEFLNMMLLDGCFIIEFFRKKTSKDDDPILKVEWMDRQICYDMLLLENQVPYFVLSQLYEMTKDPEENYSLNEMAMLVFNDLLPRAHHFDSYSIRRCGDHKMKHLLHLVHVHCHWPGATSLERNTGNSDNNEILDQLHCVVELQAAGVKFRKVGTTRIREHENAEIAVLFDVKFNDGLMQVPRFKLQDLSETLFRNLIAYEQHSSDITLKYFTDFVIFMNQLIRSEKDVKLLRLEGIIVNLLGDDKEVADLFKRLGKALIICSSNNFYFLEVCKKVNKYCEKHWSRTTTKLRADYFNSPWAGVSAIAGTVLLVLTLVQTIAALISMGTSF